MKASWVIRRSLTWTAAVLAALIVLIIGLVATIDAGYGYSLLIHGFVLRTGRAIQVNGPIQAHLLSRSPEVHRRTGDYRQSAVDGSGSHRAEVAKLTMVLKLHLGSIIQVASCDWRWKMRRCIWYAMPTVVPTGR